MEDELKEYMDAIGALAETLSIFRDELEKSGFSRDEAVFFCGTFLEITLRRNKE